MIFKEEMIGFINCSLYDIDFRDNMHSMRLHQDAFIKPLLVTSMSSSRSIRLCFSVVHL